jgi:hypothetical protein
MKTKALSTSLATVALATFTMGGACAVETELAKGPDDFLVGVDLLSKHYDQGRVLNDGVTAKGTIQGRYYDVGLKVDSYMVLGEELNNPYTGNRNTFGTTTQFDAKLDYLIEVENLLQVIPYYQWVSYPNLGNVPHSDQQHYLGVDAWWLTPLQGVELGGGVAYNPFYNADENKYGTGGGASNHDFKAGLGAREFYQHAPVDLVFWQLFNFGNQQYKQFTDPFNTTGGRGITTLDLGVKLTQPLFMKDLWTTLSLEGHFWLEKSDRTALRAANIDPNEIILSVGVEYHPE